MTKLEDEYWAGARHDQLLLQHCTDCGTYQFPPSPYCANCLKSDFTWEPARGTGTIWSWIRMHQVYYKAFADRIPYNVALVALDEGPLVMTNIVGPGADDLRVNASVSLVFEGSGDERLPKFELVS